MIKMCKGFLFAFIFVFLNLSTPLDASTPVNAGCSSLAEERIHDRSCNQLASFSQQHLDAGVYESHDIEMILSHAINTFGPEDVVVFDIDDVLITQRIDPFYLDHSQNRTPLFERFMSLDTDLQDIFLFYLNFASYSPDTISIMDDRTVGLIRELQEKGIKCMGNTAMSSGCANFNSASARLRLLSRLGYSFLCTFPDLESWDFDVLPGEHNIHGKPFFKQGIIFSGETPKHITQYELFKKIKKMPKRMMFIDDKIGNVFGMQDFFSSLGVECYSFHYLKKESKALPSYFPGEIYTREKRILEDFVEKLLAKEEIDHYFLESYNKKFMGSLNVFVESSEADERKQQEAQERAKKTEKTQTVQTALVENGPSIPSIVRSYEELYARFLRGVLIYKPNKENNIGRIELPIADFLTRGQNPLESTFDLSGCGGAGKYLSISTGYRKEKTVANAGKSEIWIVPKFVVENELGRGAAGHYRDIMSAWIAPFGIFYTWGSDENLTWYDYLVIASPEEISAKNLYENWERGASLYGVRVEVGAGFDSQFYLRF